MSQQHFKLTIEPRQFQIEDCRFQIEHRRRQSFSKLNSHLCFGSSSSSYSAIFSGLSLLAICWYASFTAKTFAGAAAAISEPPTSSRKSPALGALTLILDAAKGIAAVQCAVSVSRLPHHEADLYRTMGCLRPARDHRPHVSCLAAISWRQRRRHGTGSVLRFSPWQC